MERPLASAGQQAGEGSPQGKFWEHLTAALALDHAFAKLLVLWGQSSTHFGPCRLLAQDSGPIVSKLNIMPRPLFKSCLLI